MSDRSHKIKVFVNFIVLYLVWGLTFIWMKQASSELHPFVIIFWQNLIAGVLTAIIYAKKDFIKFVKNHLVEIISQTFFMLILGAGLITFAISLVPASYAAIIISTVPLWVVLFNFINKKFFELEKIAAVVLGFTGIIILIYTTSQIASSLLGTSLLLIAAVSWSFGLFRMNQLKSSSLPLYTSAAQMILAAMILCLLIVVFIPSSIFIPNSQKIYLAVFSLAILGSTLAYSSLIWLLQNVAPLKVSTYAYVNPLVSLIAANYLLDESLTGKQVAAVILVLLSIIFVVSDFKLNKIKFFHNS